LAIEQKNLELKKRLLDVKELSKTEYNDEIVKVEKLNQKISELKGLISESVEWLSFYTGEKYDSNNIQVAEIKKSDFDTEKYNDYTKSTTWLMYEKQLKKKEIELKVAKRTNYPKLYAYSRYYWYGSDPISYNDSFSNIEPSNFTVGGSLSVPIFDGLQNNANINKVALELKQLQVERDKAIAELMTRVAAMRSNLINMDEQIENNKKIVNELSEKQKSINKLVNKKIASPIEGNDSAIELLEQKIELDKNIITTIALTKGIEILICDSKIDIKNKR